MAKSSRLTKEDWLAAGFRALATDGPAALRAEALARSLGTTKGSFYWHFKDLPDYKRQMLMLWRTKVATEVIDAVEKTPSGAAQLQDLLIRAAGPAPAAFGGRAIEPAVRAWSLTDPDVKAALADVDAIRCAFVAKLLSDMGLTDPHLPQAVYAAYLGLDDLTAKGSGDIATGLPALMTLILRAAPGN